MGGFVAPAFYQKPCEHGENSNLVILPEPTSQNSQTHISFWSHALAPWDIPAPGNSQDSLFARLPS